MNKNVKTVVGVVVLLAGLTAMEIAFAKRLGSPEVNRFVFFTGIGLFFGAIIFLIVKRN